MKHFAEPIYMGDLRPFLRLQSDTWLNTLKQRVADAVLSGAVTTSFTNASQSGSREQVLPTAELSAQLTDVLFEKGLVSGAKPSRMTFARFAR